LYIIHFLRKPLGVAATEVTDYFNQTNKNIDGGDKGCCSFQINKNINIFQSSPGLRFNGGNKNVGEIVNCRRIFINFLVFERAIGFVFQEFMIPFLPSSSDAETLENTFRKLTSEKRQV
jgi:hypothetical protein